MALEEHLSVIRQQLLERIMNNSPSFFEQLVIDLLLKMGYGYDQNSGIVVGKSNDGGIDGVINEDKLGLDLIYLQAKRYSKKHCWKKRNSSICWCNGKCSKRLFYNYFKIH